MVVFYNSYSDRGAVRWRINVYMHAVHGDAEDIPIK
jgi:hypothetical protein